MVRFGVLLILLVQAAVAYGEGGGELVSAGITWLPGQREMAVTCRGQQDGTAICDPAKTEYYPAYSIGVVDRSECPDPSLLLYKPNCAKYVEITTIKAKGKTRWLTDEEAAKEGLTGP